MDGLGILKSEVESTILKGTKWKEEQTEKFHARMAGTEVVFMKQDEKFIIITVYLVGSEK